VNTPQKAVMNLDESDSQGLIEELERVKSRDADNDGERKIQPISRGCVVGHILIRDLQRLPSSRDVSSVSVNGLTPSILIISRRATLTLNAT
jgi:hypothetical protein